MGKHSPLQRLLPSFSESSKELKTLRKSKTWKAADKDSQLKAENELFYRYAHQGRAQTPARLGSRLRRTDAHHQLT